MITEKIDVQWHYEYDRLFYPKSYDLVCTISKFIYSIEMDFAKNSDSITMYLREGAQYVSYQDVKYIYRDIKLFDKYNCWFVQENIDILIQLATEVFVKNACI